MTKSKADSAKVWLIPSIATLVAVVIGVLLTKYLSDKPDLKFSVSSSITSKMLDDSQQRYMQEVIVFNVGSMAAKDVVLICGRSVMDYELCKSSETDNVQEYKNKDRLEIRYQDLPPKQTFKVVLKTSLPLFASDINLKHSQGVGKDILVESGTVLHLLFFYVLFIAFGFCTLGYNFKITDISYDVKNAPKKILTGKKPWYIRGHKWKTYLSDAINYFFEFKDWVRIDRLSETNGYRYLDSNKDKLNIDNDKIEYTKNAALEHFKAASLKAMEYAEGVGQASEILRLVLSMSDNQYSTIQTAISKAWVDRFFKLLKQDRNLSLEIISHYYTQPDGVLSDHYKMHVANLDGYTRYYINAFLPVDSDGDAVEAAEYFNLLSDDIKSYIKELIYKRKISKLPRFFQGEDDALEFIKSYDFSWLTDDDADRIRKNAETTIRLHKDKKTYEQLLVGINSLLCLFGKDIISMQIPDNDPSMLIAKLKEEFTESIKQIYHGKTQLEEIKESRMKVERQLEVIRAVLKGDIESFEGLEYPEELFGATNITRIREVITRLQTTV